MADEKNVQEELERDAQKKQSLPDSVQVNGGNAPIERAEYLELAESQKEFVKTYGEPNYDAFMQRVGSDGAFAVRVVTDLLSGNEGQNLGLHPDAPQENNLTGRVDRTVETPTRLKFPGQSNAKPVNA